MNSITEKTTRTAVAQIAYFSKNAEIIDYKDEEQRLFIGCFYILDKNRKIIGVDVDQASESDHIIFSAMKGVSNSVKLALEGFEKNNKEWPSECAGKTVYLGIEEDCIGLSATEGSWRMTNFTIDQYNKLYETIKMILLK